jgi:hypothetical protein
MLGGLLDTPGFKEMNSLQENIRAGASSSETSKLIDGLGVDGESVLKWAKIRALPSAISYDLWNAISSPDAKYDFLGNETGKNKNWLGLILLWNLTD